MNPADFKAALAHKADGLASLLELAIVSPVMAADPIKAEIFSRHRQRGLSVREAYLLTKNTEEGEA